MKNVECVVVQTGRDDWGEVARVEIRHDGQPVGEMRVCRYDSGETYIERIDIDEDQRGQGIGSAVLRQYRGAYIAADSERSARLYARLGELVEDPTDEMSYLDQGYGVYILTAWDDED